MNRNETPLIKAMADHYNSCTPKEQRALDRKLQQVRAQAVASPMAMFHLFPTLRAKTLKLVPAAATPAPAVVPVLEIDNEQAQETASVRPGEEGRSLPGEEGGPVPAEEKVS